MMNITDITVSLDQLLVDPNNYRLDDGKIQESVPDKDIERLQLETLEKLKFQRLGELKKSIIKHGFLEMDRIVVRELKTSTRAQLYVVVEGNRRTAALKSLIRSQKKGKTIPNSLVEQAKSINVMLVKGTTTDIKNFSSTLMGIRHVSGPKKWSGYQSAKLINDEYDAGKSFTEIGELLGITARDAGRRYRGYRAFKQMVDEGYEPKKNYYTLMLEFLAPQKEGRKWLGWDDDEKVFKDIKNRDRLYIALAGSDGQVAEITSPALARDFLKCLASDVHKEKIEKNISLSDVMRIPFNSNGDKNIACSPAEFIIYLEGFDWSKNEAEERKSLLRIQKILTDNLEVKDNE